MTTLPQLHVHTNGHALMTEQGAPFFWLGDTAWELFHRLSREEARRYFETRRRQRFNVVQAVALAEFNGLSEPNRYGELPLFDRDPTRPNDAYFRLVDEYIDMAAAHDIYIGLLPTWGDKVAKGLWMSENVIFNPENARIYGRRLGERYRERSNIIWIMGGDRPAVYDTYDERPVWRALAEGIREHIPHALMSYHTKGGQSSSLYLHDEAWLDVNMMQSGHGGGHDVPVWDWIADDYTRTPTKPTLDGERTTRTTRSIPGPRGPGKRLLSRLRCAQAMLPQRLRRRVWRNVRASRGVAVLRTRARGRQLRRSLLD